jgi:hypothetical protein
MSKEKELSDHDILYLDELKEYLVKLEQTKLYSIQRFDIIVLVISTSGIFLLINLIGTLHKELPECVLIFLKISISVFALSIVSNLASQKFAYFSSENHRKICEEKIYNLKYKSERSKHKKEEKRAEYQSRLVYILNVISLVSLVVAIIISTISFWAVA